MDIKVTSNKQECIDAKDAAIKKALEIIGIKAEKYAKALAPVYTGNLKNSISHSQIKSTMYVGTNVEYAPYQEFGTSKMKATNGGKGYLRPAVQDHLSEYKHIVQNELKK